jgi:leucyl/phenylalanyl-tRNA--protein transferase
MVLQTADFRLHASLRKTLQKFIRNPKAEIRIDTAFAQVIRACAHAPRSGQSGTWIVADMQAAYIDLHAAGLAHSVETWLDGELVGGLYCVALGRAVFGESMFTRQPDASKIALAALVALCRCNHIQMIDCQQNTRHLASLGAKEIPRAQFAAYVARSQSQPAAAWTFAPVYWNAVLPHPASPS